MDKKLIQQLLHDGCTRLAIDEACDRIRIKSPDVPPWGGVMQAALSELINRPLQGDMITVEVSDHMWVRGAYIRTANGGKIAVSVPGLPGHYTGKRVDLVVKGEEGEADV